MENVAVLCVVVGEAGGECGCAGPEGAGPTTQGGRTAAQEHNRVAQRAGLVFLPPSHPLSTPHVSQARHSQDGQS